MTAQRFRDDAYEGWVNYETWCVNLWLTNEAPLYHHWRRAAQDCIVLVENGEGNKFATDGRQRARIMLADTMKGELDVNSEAALPETGMYADLLNAALGRVEWTHIAQAFLEDVEGI